MAPTSGAPGAAYVKTKLQESDSMGKVETSAATLLSECSAVLIRRLIATSATPLTLETLKANIDSNDEFQCFRTALDDFQPAPLPRSILSKHLKRKGSTKQQTPAAAGTKHKRKRAPGVPKTASKMMEHVEPAFAAQVNETAQTTDEIIPDDEDYD